MAEGEDKSEKTEEPTERKLQKAREEGDVAKSQEISGWFTLAAGLAVVAFMAPGLTRALTGAMTVFLEQPHQLGLDPGAAMALAIRSLTELALILGLAYGLLMLAAASGNLVQHGLLWTPKKIAPKLDKLNPVEGLKRMFGPQGWVNFLKGIGKIILVGAAIALVLWPRRHDLASFPMVSPARMLDEVYEAAILLLIAALIAYAVIAALDFTFQRREFTERNKMSRKELRDEYKETEGDPLVRAKLRQIRQERAQKRMMSKVPDAAVVITNPTHYAIALEYEQGRTPAPICIAKGVDAVALRIRDKARELDIPIVEDPPLARALFATSELDEPIDPEHYAAVAKVIGYVLSLSDKRRR
ncbi:MAG: flagellar biosynthesis protein FlhB [Alphaproteobacteria bacterium]|nr:flagellar biosynthesis protein FlhB [Alphaproteobacteria bacterium]